MVDENFRTSVPSIYAVGDVIGRIQLAHAAESQGIAAVEHMQGQPVSVRMIWCRPVFTQRRKSL